MAENKIDRREVYRIYIELKDEARSKGVLRYLSKTYFQDNIANRLDCSPRTIRAILEKGFKKIYWREVEREYKELKATHKASGAYHYLPRLYFWNELADKFNCTNTYIRRVMAKHKIA